VERDPSLRIVLREDVSKKIFEKKKVKEREKPAQKDFALFFVRRRLAELTIHLRLDWRRKTQRRACRGKTYRRSHENGRLRREGGERWGGAFTRREVMKALKSGSRKKKPRFSIEILGHDQLAGDLLESGDRADPKHADIYSRKGFSTGEPWRPTSIDCTPESQK